MQKFKKLLAMVIAGVMTVALATATASAEDVLVESDETDIQFSTESGTQFNAETEIQFNAANLSDEELIALDAGYIQVMEHASQIGISLGLERDVFIDQYIVGQYPDVQSYVGVYDSLLVAMDNPESIIAPYSSSSSGSDAYYYNIGTSLPSNVTPKYSKYKILDNVKKGDIIFEANGGFGITGHIAIVEGKYTNSARGISYIRLMEAIDIGVVRSLLDDTRVDDKDVTVVRVSSATTAQKDNAVSFCVDQLGKKYSLDLAKNTSTNETSWYCSEMVWAAYKNQGYDLEGPGLGGINEPGVTPREIRNSSLVITVSFK
ncbi:MAG: hypothetical protein FWH08_00845 [Oscillospiraceae bacterium]|nr:hypothetical protein [Oscillospiraceae bacterium]